MFTALNLSPEDLETFKKLLSDKHPAEDRIKDFLGEERYSVYQDYEKKRPERAQPAPAKNAPASEGRPPDTAQEKALEEREAPEQGEQ